MSLRVIISFSALVLLAVYFAFLNPETLNVHLTRTLTLEIPMVVFLLSSLLLGVLLTAVFQSVLEIQNSLRHFQENQKVRKQEARFKKWDKWFRKAESAIASGRLPKGLALFEKILEDNPHHRGALYQLGNHKRLQKDYEKAIELHQNALLADPEDFRTLYSLAQDYAEAGQVEKEIETLNKCLELDANSLPTLRKLRDAYLSQGNLEGAFNAQKVLVGLAQDTPEQGSERTLFTQIVYRRGKELMEAGKFDAAVTEFRRAIKEDETSVPAHISLGDLYLKLDNGKQALKTWKNGFEKTGAPVCLLRIQEYHDQQEKPEEANKLFRDAIEKNDGKKQELLGLIYAQRLLAQEKGEEAVAVLEQLPQEGALITRLTAIKAYRQANVQDKADALIESIFDQTAASVHNFYCNCCGGEFETWSGLCPECGAWASVQCASSGPR